MISKCNQRIPALRRPAQLIPVPTAAAFAAVALMVAGCGGGGGSGTSSGTSTATKIPPPKPVTKLTQLVRISTSGKAFGPSAVGKLGQVVQFRTALPIKKNAPPVTVTLKIAQTSPGHLTATASGAGQTSTATLSSATGKPIVLRALHYGCLLPPAPTFCPAKSVKTTPGGGYELQFATRTPIGLIGILASSNTPPSPKQGAARGSAAYSVTQSVLASAHGAKASKPGPSASVTPGDGVRLETRVSGPSSTPKPVTVVFSHGPATTITVDASIVGGPSSHATLTAANGAKFALEGVTFTCFVPPYPTFCPANVTNSGDKYSITFNATPNAPPIVIGAKAAPG